MIRDRALEIIKAAESLRLTAYRCPAGIWTIGYGHTGDVREGQTITAHQADAILDVDLDRFEAAVDRLAPSANENQRGALVSLAFNIGVKALEGSWVLRAHRAGDHVGAAAGFGRWIHGGGKVLPGLVKRRAAEAALYLEPIQ